ncbi:MAG TPA: CRISPR-associated protein Cas4 [Chloroflexota bacterium]
MSALVVLLALALLAYAWLGRTQRRRRARLGLADGEIVAADDSALGCPTLRSDRLGLVGRPDHLLRLGRHLVPVEHKPRARHVRPSHVMQVAAQCLLVQETYGIRPPHGVLVLAGGVRHEIPFSVDLERRVIQTMAEMRELLVAGAEPGPNWVAFKCQPCGFAGTCWE